MPEIHTLKRYEVRGTSVYDLVDKQTVPVEDLCRAMNMIVRLNVVWDQVMRDTYPPEP